MNYLSWTPCTDVSWQTLVFIQGSLCKQNEREAIYFMCIGHIKKCVKQSFGQCLEEKAEDPKSTLCLLCPGSRQSSPPESWPLPVAEKGSPELDGGGSRLWEPWKHGLEAQKYSWRRRSQLPACQAVWRDAKCARGTWQKATVTQDCTLSLASLLWASGPGSAPFWEEEDVLI